VGALTWRSRRPSHPERLYAARDRMMDSGVRRAHGHFGWPPIRRTAACLDWQPGHGDRRSEIRFTGTDLLDLEPCSALDEALPTGSEMAAGDHVSARPADPFTPGSGPRCGPVEEGHHETWHSP
jgi:hypothetical protein